VSADYASPCSCDVSPCLASRSHCEPPARTVVKNMNRPLCPVEMSVSADYASPCSCDVSPCLTNRSHCEPSAHTVKRLVLNERSMQQPPSIRLWWLTAEAVSLHHRYTTFHCSESRESNPLSPSQPIASYMSIRDLHLQSLLAMRDRLISTLSLRLHLIPSHWIDTKFTTRYGRFTIIQDSIKFHGSSLHPVSFRHHNSSLNCRIYG